MSGELREPMSPSRVFLGGFLEEYDALVYPDVGPGLFLQHNHIMQDADQPAAVQVFAEGGRVTAIRLYLDGYFIVPLKRIALNPAYIFETVQRLVYVDPKAPRMQRFRFWLGGHVLRLAGWLIATPGSR